jgi:hypothetical protein
MPMVDNRPLVGSLSVIMNAITAEVLVRYEDDAILYVAYQLLNGDLRLRAATIADIARLPLIEGQPDSESGGEDEIAATFPASLLLAA